MDKKGKVICVYSPKGGNGKSFISANIAGVGYLCDYKTLIIDADIYNGSLSLFLNNSIKKSIYSLIKDIKSEKYNTLSDYVYSYNEKLDILCSCKIQLEANFIKEKYLEKIINEARSKYDLIIVDTNSVYNDFNEKLFSLSDLVLLILSNDMMCIKNMRNIITLFKDFKFKYKVLYNASYNNNNYFNYEDMMNMINNNIDYTILKEGYFKNINMYLYNNYIPILYKDNDITYCSLFNKFKLIINDMENNYE